MTGAPQHLVFTTPTLAAGVRSRLTLTLVRLTASETQQRSSGLMFFICLRRYVGNGRDIDLAVGANVFARRAFTVDIHFADRGVCAEFHGNRYADVLRNRERTYTVLDSAAHLSSGHDGGVAAAFGKGYARFGIRFHADGNTDGCRLISYGGTGYVFGC